MAQPMPPEFTRRIGANVTANGVAAAGQHTPADATAGAITLTLPSGPRYGASLSVEKVDSTTNTVTINGSIRGTANASITLMTQYESMEFRADSAGSWRPIANHLPKTYVTGQVTTAVNNLVAGAPAALDTLKEIADAFGDDPNFLAGLLTDSGLAAKITAGTGATAAVLSATYVQHLGASNGTDDTAWIQAKLDAARTAGGGKLVGKPGERYFVKRLVIGSNTILDLARSDVKQVAGQVTNILTNYSDVYPVASGTDAAVTAGSNVITTVLAQQAVVGMTAYIAGAGSNGYGELIGNVSAVNTTANTITLVKLHGPAANATTTVTAAAIQLSNRDQNITFLARNVDRGANGPSQKTVANLRGEAVGGHSIFLRGVDHFRVEIDHAASTAGISFIWPTNVAHGSVILRDCDVVRTGLQVVGPAYDLTVDYAGNTNDDLCNLCGNVYGYQTNTSGDVIGVTVINGMQRGTTTASALKLNAGQGNLVDNIRVIGRIQGESTTGWPVFVGEDTADPATTGGNYGMIDLGQIQCSPSQTLASVELLAANAHTIKARISGVTTNPVRVDGTNPHLIENLDLEIDYSGGFTNGVRVMNGATVGTLTIRANRWQPISTSGRLLTVQDAASVDHVIFENPQVAPTLTGTTGAVYLSGGTVKQLTVRNGNIVFPDASNGQVFILGTGTAIGAIKFSGGRMKNGDTLVRVNSGSLAALHLTDFTQDSSQRLLNTASAAEVYLSNVRRLNCSQSPLYPQASTLALTIRGTLTASGTTPYAGDQIIPQNGAASSLYGMFLQNDVSLIAKTANSLAWNTNAALACGVGPVICNGTNWKHLYTGATY